MHTTPEQEFHRYAEEGDLAALGRVFDRFAPDLHRVARRLAPASPMVSAEDLVQATFLTAIEKAADYDPERPLAAWLVGTLALHAKNARRKVSRRGTALSLEARAEARAEPAASEPTPADSLASVEWIGEVRSAVAGAPALYQPVLEAVLFDECSPSEAAVLLDLTPGTARQRLRRGLMLVRDALARTLGGALITAFAFQRRAGAMRTRVLERAVRMHPKTAGLADAGLPAGGVSFVPAVSIVLIAVVMIGALFWNPLAETVGADGRDSIAPAQDALVRSREKTPQERDPVAAPPLDVEASASRSEVTDRSELDSPTPVATRVADGRVHIEGSATPIPGAEVWLRRPGRDSKLVASTDSKGAFRFTFGRDGSAEASAGSSTSSDGIPNIEIRAQGFQRYVVPRGAVRRAKFVRTESITDRGEVVSFLIALMPAHHIRGRVIDEEGRGVEAELFLLSPLGDLVGESSIGRTDSEGHFDLTEVGRFFYRSPRPLPLIAIGAAGTGFVLVGEELPRDLAVGEAPLAIEDIVITLNNLEARLQVVDVGGQPLPGALVEAKANDPTWNISPRAPDEGRGLWLDELPASFAERFRTTSGSGGFATFGSLPRVNSPYVAEFNGEPLTTWTLRASLEGYMPASRDVLVVSGAARALFGDEEPTLVLERPARVRLHGHVFDESGKPAEGARIWSFDSVREIHSGPDGSWAWTIDDPARLPMRLCCDLPDLEGRPLIVTREDIEGQKELVRDFRFEPAVGFAIQTVDESGKPVDGIHLGASRVNATTGVLEDLGGMYTQMGGWARYRTAPAGEYSVRIGPLWSGDGLDVEKIELTIHAGEERVVPVVVRG